VNTDLSECCDKPAPGRCFIGSERFDVLSGGRKIAGAAQKRNKLGLLVQGSIQPPNPASPRPAWEKSLLATGENNLELSWLELKLPDEIRSRAAALDRDKYSTVEYNQRR
jgi:lipoate-protein ligase A